MNEYTPLPVAKWTNSSILKIHEQIWSNYLSKILESKHKDKNQRIDKMLVWFQLIERLCINKELTIKKK